MMEQVDPDYYTQVRRALEQSAARTLPFLFTPEPPRQESPLLTDVKRRGLLNFEDDLSQGRQVNDILKIVSQRYLAVESVFFAQLLWLRFQLMTDTSYGIASSIAPDDFQTFIGLTDLLEQVMDKTLASLEEGTEEGEVVSEVRLIQAWNATKSEMGFPYIGSPIYIYSYDNASVTDVYNFAFRQLMDRPPRTGNVADNSYIYQMMLNRRQEWLGTAAVTDWVAHWVNLIAARFPAPGQWKKGPLPDEKEVGFRELIREHQPGHTADTRDLRFPRQAFLALMQRFDEMEEEPAGTTVDTDPSIYNAVYRYQNPIESAIDSELGEEGLQIFDVQFPSQDVLLELMLVDEEGEYPDPDEWHDVLAPDEDIPWQPEIWER